MWHQRFNRRARKFVSAFQRTGYQHGRDDQSRSEVTVGIFEDVHGRLTGKVDLSDYINILLSPSVTVGVDPSCCGWRNSWTSSHLNRSVPLGSRRGDEEHNARSTHVDSEEPGLGTLVFVWPGSDPVFPEERRCSDHYGSFRPAPDGSISLISNFGLSLSWKVVDEVLQPFSVVTILFCSNIYSSFCSAV